MCGDAQCLEVTRPAGVLLLIDDRVDVALAAGVDGVHVGQSDISCADARRMLGPHAVIGISCKTVDQALKAVADGADYLGVGAVRDTTTKVVTRVIGYDGLREICEAVSPFGVPIVAIGGLDASNAAACIAAGADGVAVVSAIFRAADRAAAAAELRRIVDEALQQASSMMHVSSQAAATI